MQEHQPMAEVVITQYYMRKALQFFCDQGATDVEK